MKMSRLKYLFIRLVGVLLITFCIPDVYGATLVCEWKMDENTGSMANDYESSNYNAHGSIHEVACYDEALTAEEIEADYQGDSPAKWGFEAGTEYWIPRANPVAGLGCSAVTQSSAYHTEGSYSLEMHMDLQKGVPNMTKGEAFVLCPCGDLDGKAIAVDIYCPTGSSGSPSAYNGLQVFVKDSEYRNEYGKWKNISDGENTWYTVTLTVDGVSDGSGAVVESGFDPTDIIQIGVKMGLNSYATSGYSGSIYVDNVCVDIIERTPPGPAPASDYSFDFSNMTSEIQTSKNFVAYSEHRPFWDIDEGWNAGGWHRNDITIQTIDEGNKVLSINVNIKGEGRDEENFKYRKGCVMIQAFPNIDISNKDSKIVQFRVKFPDLAPGQYVGTAQVFCYNRTTTESPPNDWFVGPRTVVGGTEWQQVSFDLGGHPEEDLMQLLKVGMQLWGDVPFTGKMYVDDITIGGEESDNFVNQNEGFVTANGAHFEVNGECFFFAGSNCYYPFYKTHFMVNDLMDTLQANGIRVLRIWGFCDGLGKFVGDNDDYTPNGNEGCTFHPKLGKYDELTFKQLDYVVKCAGEHGIRLIVPLVNYWSDADKLDNWPSQGGVGENSYGGIAQYVKWDRGSAFTDSDYIYDPSYSAKYPYRLKPEIKNSFYTNANIKQTYKNYISELLNRVNSLTGVAYKNDPTIFAWELVNEPENESDPGGTVLKSWASEMASHIKGIDSNHMVALGDCGFMDNGIVGDEGGDDWLYDGFKGIKWKEILQLSNIDFGTTHVYPDHWKIGENYMTPAETVEWIEVHIDNAVDVGKPVVFEEFGVNKYDLDPPSQSAPNPNRDRDTEYQVWTDLYHSYNRGAGGDCVWMIGGKVNNTDEDRYPPDPELYYPDYDGFCFWDHSQTASTMNIIKKHAAAMNNKGAKGDVNFDGSVDLKDLVLVLK